LNKYIVLVSYPDTKQVIKRVGDIVMLTEQQAMPLIKSGKLALSQDLVQKLVDLRYDGQRLFLYNVATGARIGEVTVNGITGTLIGNSFGTHYGNVQGNVTGDLTGNSDTATKSGGVNTDTPVNAIAGNYVIAATTIAILANGDTIKLAGATFVKAAITAGDFDFADAAGLATQITKLADYTALEGAGAVTVTRAVKGVAGNGFTLVVESVEATTAGGDGAGTEATATISASTIALIANGDTVEFDGNTFTKVAAAPGATDFVDQAGLIALIHALADWTAVNNAGDIDITAATDAVAFNGIDVNITLNRVTAGGVDGTVGVEGDMVIDTNRIYVCTAANTIADSNWKRIPVAMETF
jgi:hypothetical protein